MGPRVTQALNVAASDRAETLGDDQWRTSRKSRDANAAVRCSCVQCLERTTKISRRWRRWRVSTDALVIDERRIRLNNAHYHSVRPTKRCRGVGSPVSAGDGGRRTKGMQRRPTTDRASFRRAAAEKNRALDQRLDEWMDRRTDGDGRPVRVRRKKTTNLIGAIHPLLYCSPPASGHMNEEAVERTANDEQKITTNQRQWH